MKRITGRARPVGSALLSLFVMAAHTAGAAPPKAPEYHEVARYEIGGDGFWDYLTCDSAGKRIFVTRGSHVHGHQHGDRENLSATLSGVKGCHGVALAPEFKTGYISSGGERFRRHV